MILDDATYADTFDIPDNIPGFTIRSASGDAYKYVVPLILNGSLDSSLLNSTPNSSLQ